MNETSRNWWNSVKLSRRTVLVASGAITSALFACRQNRPNPECYPAVETPGYVTLHGLESIAVSKNLTFVNHDTNNSISVDPNKLQEFVNSPHLGAFNLPENVVFLVHFVPTSLMTKESQDRANQKYINVAFDITLLRERMRELEKQNKKLPSQRPFNILISIPDGIKKVKDRFASENQEKESCQFQLLFDAYLSLTVFGSIARTMSRGYADIQSGKLKILTDFEDRYKPIRVRLNNEFLSNLLK